MSDAPHAPSPPKDLMSVANSEEREEQKLRSEIVCTLSEIQDGAGAKGDHELAALAEWLLAKTGYLFYKYPPVRETLPEKVQKAIAFARRAAEWNWAVECPPNDEVLAWIPRGHVNAILDHFVPLPPEQDHGHR